MTKSQPKGFYGDWRDAETYDRPETTEVGARVYGGAGVFYPDRGASGTVLNALGDCVHVRLDDGDRAVVPIKSVEPEDVS